MVAAAFMNGIPLPIFQQPFLISTETVQRLFQQICYRHSAIILERIPMTELINPEANSFIPTGSEEEEILLLTIASRSENMKDL